MAATVGSWSRARRTRPSAIVIGTSFMARTPNRTGSGTQAAEVTARAADAGRAAGAGVLRTELPEGRGADEAVPARAAAVGAFGGPLVATRAEATAVDAPSRRARAARSRTLGASLHPFENTCPPHDGRPSTTDQRTLLFADRAGKRYRALVLRRPTPSLTGRRVLITGAARGIGAALAQRLHHGGARLALAGLEEDLLAETAAGVDAPWWSCDVTDRLQVDAAVAGAAETLGGLDVVVANAGIAAQLPIVGGDPAIFERIMAVNVLGTYYTLRAAGPHLSHPQGYAVAISSLGGVVHVPLLGAYSTSKAGVEALGNTLRMELAPSGGKVGVAYFAELDTDMTTRGFDTKAAKSILGGRSITKVTPLKVGIDALERGIAHRSRRIVAPGWVAPILPVRMVAQRVVEVATRRRVEASVRIARDEQVELTTPQPPARS